MGRGATLAKTTRPSAAAVIPRERLFAVLDARRRAALVWVHGPPGCGKTSLVSSYLDARASNGLWYQLDPGDADPANLCLYLGDALDGSARTLPLFTAEYGTQPLAFARHYFRSLFASLEPPFLLVFDNYHELGPDAPVHEMLREAVTELPADGCMVVLSREPPPAAFIRMRANRELEVLGWDALRLSREESDAIVRTRVPDAAEQFTRALYERTDGWAAVLILALEQGQFSGPDVPPDGAAPQLLFEYLAGEVVGGFDPEVRELLTRTAFVDEMTVDLAATLAAQPRAGELLDVLHRRHQLVTMKPGPRGPVYACHPLLREYLRAQAERSLEPRVRAAIVCEAAGRLEGDGAVDAALRLLSGYGDARAVCAALLRTAPVMIADGRTSTLERWIATLPPEVRDEDPWLCYWHGACRFQQQPAQAQRIFEAAFALFTRHRPHDHDGLALTAAYAMHAVIYALDDLSALDAWIVRAEALSDGVELGTQAQARLAVCLFMALVFRQPHNARIGERAERALDACGAVPDAQLRLSTQLLLAINLNYTGQFDRALDFLRTMRTQADAPGAPALQRTTLKAVESMYHMLNAQAEPCVKAVFDGLDIGDETGVTLWSYHLLSNGVGGALGAGDLDTASELLERMDDYAAGARRLDRSGFHYFRAWHAMLRGDVRAAAREQRTALALALECGCPFYVALCRLALAQILVERGDAAGAAAQLRDVHAITRRINNRLLEYTALLCFAGMALACGRRAPALRALARGLAVGREHGFYHFLWWIPDAMSRICALALDAGMETEYVRALIRRRGLRPPRAGSGRARWPWPIEIDTLGGFRVRVHGGAASGARLSGKPLALLKALVGLGGGARVEETVIAGHLWPRIDADYARRSLATTLHRLRRVLGEEGAVVLRHGRLRLDPALCGLDLPALDTALADIEAIDDGRPRDAAALSALAATLLDRYRGPFMDGDAAPAFSALRERVRNRVLGALDTLARACEDAGAAPQALAFYRRAIEQDPLAEAFHRRLMLSLRDLGRSAEAVEAYARCRSLLAAAGSGPSAETEAIYAAVRKDL